MQGVTVYRVPRLTLFGKLPDETPTGLRKLFYKAQVLVGYVTEYSYFTSACLLLSFYIARPRGIRCHPCAQPSRHSRRGSGAFTSCLARSRYSTITTCARNSICHDTRTEMRVS